MHDQLLKQRAFAAANANASLSLIAPPDVVDSFLLLRHKVDTLQLQKRQQLEEMHKTFSVLQTGILRDLQTQRVSATSLEFSASTGEADVSVAAALSAATTDINIFSVASLKEKLLALPSSDRRQRDDCLKSLWGMLYQCEDSLQPPQKESCEKGLLDLVQQQGQQECADIAQQHLFQLIGGALETFPATLFEALDLAGLSASYGSFLF